MRPSFAKYGRVGKGAERRAHAVYRRTLVRVGFAELVIGPATSGRTRWLSPPYKIRYARNDETKKGGGTPANAVLVTSASIGMRLRAG